MNRNNWYLWVGIFLMLGVIARYTYMARQPYDECRGFLTTDNACEALHGLTPEQRIRLDAQFGGAK